MTEKIYAPQVDNFISRLGDRNRGGFNNNCTFTEESYKLIDRFLTCSKEYHLFPKTDAVNYGSVLTEVP